MNDSTKELFDAPWSIEEEAPLVWYCVIDSKDSVVANDVRDQKTVNRLARLPELYEALVEAAYRECHICIYEKFKYEGRIVDERIDLIEKGCPFHVEEEDYCPSIKWLALLKRVRDGK